MFGRHSKSQVFIDYILIELGDCGLTLLVRPLSVYHASRLFVRKMKLYSIRPNAWLTLPSWTCPQGCSSTKLDNICCCLPWTLIPKSIYPSSKALGTIHTDWN